MSPYSRRTGKRYAAGSQATWSVGDDRFCYICGKKIALVHGAHVHYDAVKKEHRSTHLKCGSPL